MKRSALATLAFAILACATPMAAEEVDLSNDDNKALYALGQLLSARLGQLELTPEELKVVVAGMEDGVFKREPRIALSEHQAAIDGFFRARYARLVTKFLEGAAAQPGAVKTPTGMVFIETEAGTGESPAASDTVKLHYHGSLPDGSVFDSSVQRGEPATFQLDQVIPCFSEGLQRMKIGGKAKLYCPPEMAYGERGAPPRIPGGSALLFEVELLEIQSASN
jgi:FKBP-type peptidyl-prolyl cis-trans isomerase FkpA